MATATGSSSFNFNHAVSDSSQVKVVAVPANSDNYMYLIIDKETMCAGVVDPVDPAAVLRAALPEKCTIESILTTHNHWDHAGGNNELKEQLGSQLKVVYGGRNDNAQGVTQEVDSSSSFQIGTLNVRVFYTPCHTPGHVCYLVEPKAGLPCVFTGDTLFVGGCGNFNSGTPQQMHDAFKQLGALDPQTLVFVGHEYTVANLQYAAYVEPSNAEIAQKLKWAQSTTAQGKFTVPSTIEEEHATSPFMRAAFGNELIMQHCKGVTSTVDAVLYVRKEKSAGAWKSK